MITNDKTLQSFLCRINKITKTSNLYIYGTGSFGTFLAECLSKHKIDFYGFVVTDIQNAVGSLYMGKPVVCVSVLSASEWFLISSLRYNDEMEKNLLRQGIPEGHIISFSDYSIIYDAIIDAVEPEQYTAKIKRFKDVHKGERCFVIGNGPSLRISDLDKLKNFITMGSNNIIQAFDKTDWRPTYYFESDLDLSKKLFPGRNDILSVCSYCRAVFTGIWANLYQYRDDPDFLNLFFFAEQVAYDSSQPFCNDVSNVTYGGCTVTYIMLQFAAYMGFNEIYLLGVDHSFTVCKKDDGSIQTFSENKRNHADFMDDLIIQSNQIPMIDKVDKAYLSVREYAGAHGIKIYNATRGGKLEVFERVDFDSLF